MRKNGAVQNKFGSFCLRLEDWSVDIGPVDSWNACDTWAIGESVRRFSADTIIQAEIKRYAESIIRPEVLSFFGQVNTDSPLSFRGQFVDFDRVYQPSLV